MSTRKVAPHDLNDVMDLDHVIRVNDDGTVSDYPTVSGIYAPDVVNLPYPGDIEIQSPLPWKAETGRTGQYGYSGAVMHPSEYIGAGLASYILATPGYWVAVEVRDDDGTYPEGDPVGWALLHLALEA